MADAIAYGHAGAAEEHRPAGEAGRARPASRRSSRSSAPRPTRVVKLGTALADGDAEFVVLDLETTAMKPENGYIVDIAALRVRDGEVVDRFESLVNPGRSIIGHQIHGISRRRRRQVRPTAAEVLTKLRRVGSARRRWSRTTSAFDLPFIAAPPAARRRLAAERGLSTRSSSPTSSTPMPAATSSPTWSASSSAVTTAPRTGPCPTRRRPPSCSSTSPTASPTGSRRSAPTSPTRSGARRDRLRPQRSRASGWRTSGGATASAPALMDVLTKATVRELVLSENIRIDGRDTTTIRPISVEVGVLPRTHGSGPLHPRPDPGAQHRDPRARRATSSASTRSPRRPRSATCTTTTSRRTRSARRARCAAPAGARSATARSPSGPCCRSCRPRRSSRTRSASCPRW